MTTTTISLDAAQQQLGDAGYEVRAVSGWGIVTAELAAGEHRASVVICEQYRLVTTYRHADGGTPTALDEWWPDTVADTVKCAVALAGRITKAHAAELVPAVIGDELAAALDQAPEPERAALGEQA